MRTTTRIELSRAGGRPVLDLDAGHLRPFVLADDAGRGVVSVAVVPAVAMLLAGDDVRLRVVVGAGCRLRIVEPAGTVAYHMRGGSAVRSVRVEVGPDATLVWAAQPLVVADGARLELDGAVDVAAGGRALLREPLVFGRSGESGGELLTRTRATVAGRPALVEELDLGRAARADPIVLAGHRCMDTVTALGWRLPGADPALLQLHAPGSVHRVLVDDLPASPLPGLFAAAERSLAGARPAPGPAALSCSNA